MATAASRSLGPCSFCNVALGPRRVHLHPLRCQHARRMLLGPRRAPRGAESLHPAGHGDGKDEFQADVVCVACRKGGA
jgi:hypothetical protein